MRRNIRKRMSYTLDEISEHCRPDDLWIIVHKKVFDVTDFQFMHPGGKDLFLEYAGTDASQPFVAMHQHSDIAFEIMERYFIGYVWESDNLSDTSSDSTDSSSSGPNDADDQEGQEPSRAQLNDPYRPNLGAGPSSNDPSSSTNPSSSRYQSNGGLADQIMARLRAINKKHEIRKSNSANRQDNDRAVLILSFGLLAVCSIVLYKITRS